MVDHSGSQPFASGVNAGNPRILQGLARDLRDTLGDEWVREELAAADGSTLSSAPVLDIVRAFGRLTAWLEALQKGAGVSEEALFFKFVMVAHVLSRAKAVEGFEGFRDELRSLARAREAERFYDKVFEAEVAVYFSDNMGAEWARFGPKAGHPDIWTGFPVLHSRLLLPTECKRISPQAEHDRDIDMLSVQLEDQLRRISSTHGPLKAIVWLHGKVSAIAREAVTAVLEQLGNTIGGMPATSSWITASHPEGKFQVSVARLGFAGEFQPPGIHVADVSAAPALLVRSEVRRKTETETEVRITSILSVRSDRKPAPMGKFRERLDEAIGQLCSPPISPSPGAVALRIRPPRDLGDIYEHDRAVRTRLEAPDAERVAFVVLFSNVSERVEGSEIVGQDGNTAKEVTAAYHFRPYFITNPSCPLRITGLDSFAQYFPGAVPVLIRDAESGALTPVTTENVESMRNGMDLPEQLIRASSTVDQPFTEAEGVATILARFAVPLGELPGDGPIGVVMAGPRQFRFVVDKDRQLRVVELWDGIPRAVSTIDLRAWWSQSDLCATVEWKGATFQAGVWLPDDKTRVLANSSRLRPIPTIPSPDSPPTA